MQADLQRTMVSGAWTENVRVPDVAVLALGKFERELSK